MVKREIGIPVVIGAILVALCLVGFFFYRSLGASEPHEKPAPAKDPETNPMFQKMKESMRKSPPATGTPR